MNSVRLEATQINNYILSVVNTVVISILGIQILPVLIPVNKGDKRFNQ